MALNCKYSAIKIVESYHHYSLFWNLPDFVDATNFYFKTFKELKVQRLFGGNVGMGAFYSYLHVLKNVKAQFATSERDKNEMIFIKGQKSPMETVL